MHGGYAIIPYVLMTRNNKRDYVQTLYWLITLLSIKLTVLQTVQI